MPRHTHILVVDGSPLHTRVLVHLLEQSRGHFRIYTAETLTGAYELLQENPIEIVLLDLHLPGSKEYLLIEQFRQKHPDLPLILLANRDNEVLLRQAMRAGISDFLIKGDIEARPLRRSIALALNQHQLITNLRRENRQLHSHAEKIKAVDEIAGFGYFTLDIVSGKMEWSEQMYQLLNQPPGGTPTLSDYINRVHHLDRKAVSDFFVTGSEDNSVREIPHRILIDGHRPRRVRLRIRSIPLEVNDRVLLIGTLWQAELPANRPSYNPNTHFSMEVGFPLEHALNHQRNALRRYRQLDELSTSGQIANQLKKLRSEHETLTEMVFRSVRNNFRQLPPRELRQTVLLLTDLQEHLANYFWLRAVNLNIPVETHFDSHEIRKIQGNYTLIFCLVSAWIDRLLVDIDPGPKTTLKLHIFPIGPARKSNTGELALEVSGLPRPLRERNRLPANIAESSEYRDETESGIFRLGLEKGHCRTDFRLAEDFITECLYLAITHLRRGSQSRSFTDDAPLRLLIAEDHLLSQVALQKVFEKEVSHIKIDMVSNGREAVELITRFPKYDLILLDLQMPVMDGLEAARRIRMQTSIPLVGLISEDSPARLRRARTSGFSDFLSKPVRKRALQQLLRKFFP